jgi:hypothetical protein
VETQRAADERANIYPANYRVEILAHLRTYLNDPTGVRDAAISEPAIRPPGTLGARYVVCLRYNVRKSGGGYFGIRDTAAVFVSGKLDKYGAPVGDVCKDAVYAPFAELERLTR